MRIEVVVDVKTILGEGPLWDVDQQRLYFIDSRLQHLPLHRRRPRDPRLGRAGKDRLDRPAQGRQGCHLLAAKRLSCSSISRRGDVELIRDPEPDKPTTGSMTARSTARPLRCRLDGHDGGRTQRRALSSRSRLLGHKLDGGIIVSNGPCWSPDDKIFYLPIPGRARSGPMTTTSRPARSPTGAPSPRSIPRDGGAADGSTVDAEGCPVECPGL